MHGLQCQRCDQTLHVAPARVAKEPGHQKMAATAKNLLMVLEGQGAIVHRSNDFMKFLINIADAVVVNKMSNLANASLRPCRTMGW